MQGKLDDLVGKLTVEGVNAAAFPADVLDRAGLTEALQGAAAEFGGIDVSGIQAAHVGIDMSIGVSVIPGLEAARPERIAPLYWELHTSKRDRAELVFKL